jgi:hypothetical protein
MTTKTPLLFKIIGKADTARALAQLAPIIQEMEDEDLDQWGLKGRIDEDDAFDYGEGKTRSGVALSAWSHWRDEKYNSGWLAEIIELLKPREIGRIRVMRMKPRTCYSWHRDLTPRVHIPLITSGENFMIIRTESRHLYTKAIWWTDTTQNHSAMNCSEINRYHLILEVSE